MYETPAPQPAKKKRNSWLLAVLVGVAAVLLLCVGVTVGVGVTADGAKNAATVAPNSAPNAQQPVVAATTAAVPTTPAAPPPPPPPVIPTIEDGTWTVGVDIPAGRYRTTTNVGANCYWGIYKSGTNGSEIIENDIPGGGRPSVTLKAGQDFRTSRCGKWSKVG